MITTHVGAYQEMCARIRAACATSAVTTLIGYAPIVRYDDINYSAADARAVVGKYWVRFSQVSAGEKRRTLATPARRTHHGTATVQLFIPREDASAAGKGYNLAQLIEKAYSTSTASVDFSRGMIRNAADEESWFAKQITATYEYQTYD